MDVVKEETISPNGESNSSGFEDEEQNNQRYQAFIPSLANENFGIDDDYESSGEEQKSEIKLPPSIYSQINPKRLSK